MNHQEVTIRSFPVELFKVMQIAGWVGSGGQAKAIIADGMVLLNGTTETQKRKKCMAGDTITFNDQSVVLASEV